MRAIASGWAVAVALLSVVTFATHRIALGSGASTIAQVRPDDPQVDVIIYGLMAAVAVAGTVAWWLMQPVASTFRRFGLSMVGALGGFVIGAVLTTLAREIAGPTALLILAALSALAAVMLARRARLAS